jgi:branched-subunit amino acid transport protein AzlD
MLNLAQASLAAGAMALTIIACRALPFLFFSGNRPPKTLSFLEIYMPAIAMTVLVVASYTSLDWSATSDAILQLAAGILVLGLHVWKRNALVSILGGTIFYMISLNIFPV